MGWFSGLGNFLGGYAQARHQKQQDRSMEHERMMNEAQQWASVADRASGPGGDAIREMATKNMQDLIVKYEKSAGEKNGLGSIIKMFGGNKKDAPSILNKLAPQLSQRVEPISSPLGTDLQDNSGRGPTASQAQPDTSQQLPVQDQAAMASAGGAPAEHPSETAENIGAAIGSGAAGEAAKGGAGAASSLMQPPTAKSPSAPETTASGPNFNTVSDQSQAAAAQPQPSGINAPAMAGNQGAAQRFQQIAAAAAPGRSVFTPQYAGGTRYSPTYQEIEASRMVQMQKEAEMQSSENLKNAKSLADFQDKRTQTLQDQKEAQLKQQPLFINSSPEMQNRMLLESRFGIKAPEPTPYDLAIVGPQHLDPDGEVRAKNRMGQDMIVTSDWKKENPIAASYMDRMPADKKDLNIAQREAGKYEDSARQTKLDLERSQAERNRKISLHEQDQADRENRLMLTTSQGQAQKELARVDNEWDKHLKTLTSGLTPGRTLDEFITGKDSKGAKSSKYKGETKDDGSKFKDVKEYENYWKSKQLPSGIDANRYRVFMMTGIDPMGELSGSYKTPQERDEALGRNRVIPGKKSTTTTKPGTPTSSPEDTATRPASLAPPPGQPVTPSLVKPAAQKKKELFSSLGINQ